VYLSLIAGSFLVGAAFLAAGFFAAFFAAIGIPFYKSKVKVRELLKICLEKHLKSSVFMQVSSVALYTLLV
jgi:hypothetical protein